MKGKVCVVTGASSGIGKEMARELARMGARVGMVCRSREKGEAVRAEILGSVPGGDVVLHVADLGVQAEVRGVAEEILGAHGRLDVLINNAGVWLDKRTETVDGLETTFAVNHLSYYMLTLLLMERLKGSAPSRVVNVSSKAHLRAKLHLDDLQGVRTFGRMQTYGQSKLCNILFSGELARRLEGTGVTVNSLHPGVITTGLGGGTLLGMFFKYGPFLLTPEEGAKTALYLATSGEVAGVSGRYFSDCKQETPSAAARDVENARALWAISAKLTGVDL